MNIQIFGTKKCNDTKKAQRYFKERGIKFQFIDMSEKEISKGEFRSVCQAVGGINAMINEDCKDKDALALVKYISQDEREEKLLANQQVIKTPIVRNDYYAIHRKYWNEYASEIDWITHDIKELKAKCPKGITINSYMITELLRANSECEVVGIPVSIREDKGMSNQTSGIAVKYKYNSKKTFEENANRVHKAIYKKLKNRDMKYFILLFMERLCPSLIDAVLLQSHGCYQDKLTEKMAKVMGYIGDGGKDLGVTNINKIDIPSVYERFVITDIMFVPPKVSYSKKVIGISTYADKLIVCYHRLTNKI